MKQYGKIVLLSVYYIGRFYCRSRNVRVMECLVRERPSWDDFYMLHAFWASKRSPDERTQHGAFLTTADHVPISEGYNGYPPGCDDKNMPQNELKYYGILHGECNCILHATRDLNGSTLYVTGMPCARCWAMIIHKKIKRVVYGPIQSRCIDESDVEMRKLLLTGRDIEIVEWTGDNIPLIREKIKEIDTLLAALDKQENNVVTVVCESEDGRVRTINQVRQFPERLFKSN